ASLFRSIALRSWRCVSAKIGAPPSLRSSRLTEVSTTCLCPILLAASVTRRGSSQSSSCGGRPVFTAQKEQERVHTSPRIIKVAVPLPQHSPILGQRASEQTVFRECF